jgi:hypothetical protein
MSKLIEAMARTLFEQHKTTLGDQTAREDWLNEADDWRDDARAVLAAMCEGGALEEMVERAEVAMKSIDDGKQTYGSLSAAAIRAALMVEP